MTDPTSGRVLTPGERFVQYRDLDGTLRTFDTEGPEVTPPGRVYPPDHPFDANPKSSLPGVYCKCGYDVDVHPDKGNATVRDGRYVLPDATAPARNDR